MIIKEKLADLSMCYCIGLIHINGREYCISASEERDGKIIMIDTATKKETAISGLSGGVMAIVPVPEIKGAFLAIQKFYPVFDSGLAEVVLCRLGEEVKDNMQADVTLLQRIPFVHRISLSGEPGKRKLIASTLCRNKKSAEDWSEPGSVYEYTLDKEFKTVSKRTLIEKVSRNHGMYNYEKEGGAYLLISGDDGVFAIDKDGVVIKLCAEPISDLCMFDIDGDGTDEIICIAPFHGNHMKVLKRNEQKWDLFADEPVTFGHGIWSGKCGNQTMIISLSRGGDKGIRLYKVDGENNGKLKICSLNIDEGVGASNLFVKEDVNSNAVILYTANHEAGEISRYTIMF